MNPIPPCLRHRHSECPPLLQPAATRLLSLLLLLLVSLAGGACAPVNRLMKAKATTPDRSFIDFAATPDNVTALSPWHYAARSVDRMALGMASHRRRIYIAPVLTGSLRPISKKLAATEYTRLRPQQTAEIAHTLRTEFARALTAVPGSRWRLAMRPAPDALTLELNLLELDPTSAKGNVTKTVVKYTVGPLFSMGVGLFTGGRIAIEGRLKDGATGHILFQFADREKDKATIYNARDYMALGHASRTAREWAGQFAAFLQNPDQKLKDSFFLTPLVY